MRESVGVWNNANTWVIIEWYLHVAGCVCLLIVCVCVVVCVVLVLCAAVKTGVEDVSNMLLCAGSWLRVCNFWPWFFEKNYVLHCHGFVLRTGSPVRCILPLHCFIVILDPVLFSCEGKRSCMVASFWPFPCQSQSVWVGFLRQFQILGWAGGFYDWWGFTSVSKIIRRS